ncbi:hypothetical protein [Pseudomonas quasicaspiana]|jgi:hypothetical protein|uniref:hypothetical protein n=1 Tax=Pseudomonas quasicaspiana TaxID=2829821 RepID=UPI001E2FE061|nr:hypothetical protein [Pseudomonas quasicaspiana]MCD5970801.1 hypothetical protein [Pseudomonas quasicaspiana]
MSVLRLRITTVSVFASLALGGCAMQPAETWTNLGPSRIVTEGGQYVCYADAQIVEGKRMRGNLCATAASGFLSDGEPEIWAGTGYRMPFKFPLSTAIKGTMVPLDDKDGLLKCEPLKSDTSKATRETFCKVTINDQVLVSSEVVFQGK